MKLIERTIGDNGIETTDYHDPATGGTHVHRVQDVQPVLDANKAEYNSYGDLKSSRYKGPMHKVASIPIIVVEKWMQEGFNIYTATPEEIRRKLNSPENRYLRTMPGKL